NGSAGGGIAHVADRHLSRQAVDHFLAREGIADETEPLLGMKPLPVEGDDAGRLLAAVLKRVQAERGDLAGVRMAVDAEDTALLTQPIAVEIEVEAGVAGVHLARLLRVQRCIPTVFTGARAKRRSRPVRLPPGASSCCCSSVPRDLKPLRYLSMSS